MAETATWLGYDFYVLKYDEKWSSLAGLYIFCGQKSGFWTALYVGQAESFAVRIPNHERWPEAVRQGATHVHARAESDKATRDSLESQLIQRYQPPLNRQLK